MEVSKPLNMQTKKYVYIYKLCNLNTMKFRVFNSRLSQTLIVALSKHLVEHSCGTDVAAKPCLVLELFLQLCQASFTASELTAFLSLFQEDHPPLVGNGICRKNNLYYKEKYCF